MKLIADSGATKTDWCIGENQSDYRIIHTQGINPFHQSREHIGKVLKEELLPQLEKQEEISHIYFYVGILTTKINFCQFFIILLLIFKKLIYFCKEVRLIKKLMNIN